MSTTRRGFMKLLGMGAAIVPVSGKVVEKVIEHEMAKPKPDAEKIEPSATRQISPPIRKHNEGYQRLKFHSRQSALEPENVVISVNGETIACKRNAEVVLPNRFVECAEHCSYPAYASFAGVKRVEHRKMFPFTKLGKSTFSEFRRERG